MAKALNVQTGKIEEVTASTDIPSAEEELHELRIRRNGILASTDWIVIKEREEGGSVSNFADWKKYRQELRDITNTYKSLNDIGDKWPTAPSE